MENQVRGKVFGLQFGYPSCALSKQKTEENLWTVCLARATTSPSRLRVVRITSGTELSRHFRMPRSATLNIIAGQAATCHEQSSASRCRRHRHRASPSPKIFADMKVLDSGRPAESSDYSRMVRPEAMGQAASARRDAARHADRHFPDATVIRDCHATGLQDARFFYYDRLARRVVRIAHLQTAFGSTVRACRRRVAHHVRHRSRFLNHACPIDTYAHHHG